MTIINGDTGSRARGPSRGSQHQGPSASDQASTEPEASQKPAGPPVYVLNMMTDVFTTGNDNFIGVSRSDTFAQIYMNKDNAEDNDTMQGSVPDVSNTPTATMPVDASSSLPGDLPVHAVNEARKKAARSSAVTDAVSAQSGATASVGLAPIAVTTGSSLLSRARAAQRPAPSRIPISTAAIAAAKKAKSTDQASDSHRHTSFTGIYTPGNRQTVVPSEDPGTTHLPHGGTITVSIDDH